MQPTYLETGPSPTPPPGADGVTQPETTSQPTDQATSQDGKPPSLLNPTVSGMLFAGSIMIIIFVLLRAARKKRTKLGIPTERPGIGATGIAAGAARDEIHTVLADAADVARQLAAAMEMKAARLEVLIEDADARIAELDRRLGTRGLPQAGPIHDVHDIGHVDAPLPSPPPLAQGHMSQQGSQTGPMGMSERRDSVQRLIKQGMSDAAISRQTGIATGEISLLRQLHAATSEARETVAQDRPASARASRSLEAYLDDLTRGDRAQG